MDDVTPRARSIYLGHQLQEHDGGAAITESTYTLRKRGISRLLEVADAMDELITKSVGSLVSPATITHLLPIGASARDGTRDHVVQVLTAHGYMSSIPIEDDAIELAEAAGILGMTTRQMRKLAQRGELERRQIEASGRAYRTGVSMTSVMSLLDSNQKLWTRKQLYEEFDLSYYELNLLIKRLGVEAVEGVVALGSRYLESEVEKIRLHLAEQGMLRSTALRITDVVRETRLNLRSVYRLVQSGQLQVDDAATQEFGMVMVNRESVERFNASDARRFAAPSPAPEGTIPILKAQELTGLSRIQFLALRKKGVIIRRTRDYQFHVDETSLNDYLKGNQ
jgi:hypothetical protein